MAETPRVLHVISNDALGGAQSLVRDLVKKNQAHFVFVLRKTEDKQFQEVQEKCTFFDSTRAAKFRFRILTELIRTFDKLRCTHIHVHLVKPLVYAAILKLRRPRVRIMYHEHGLIMGSDRHGRRLRWYPLFLFVLQVFVTRFIVISRALRDLYIRSAHVTKNKVQVLYNFIDLETFQPGDAAERASVRHTVGLAPSDIVIGFAGRFVERKGWREFLEAAVEICPRRPQFRFLLAGDGPDTEKITTFIRDNNLTKNVTVLGRVEKMHRFYTMIDGFVIPSHWEPMGLTELEAQAMRVPVIASDVPALNEVVYDGDNGLLFPARDASALATKILDLFADDTLRTRLIEEGRRTVKEYSLDTYNKNLHTLYEQD